MWAQCGPYVYNGHLAIMVGYRGEETNNFGPAWRWTLSTPLQFNLSLVLGVCFHALFDFPVELLFCAIRQSSQMKERNPLLISGLGISDWEKIFPTIMSILFTYTKIVLYGERNTVKKLVCFSRISLNFLRLSGIFRANKVLIQTGCW